MRRARRQVENLARANRQVAALALVLHAQDHLAFELVEEFRALVPVVIAARVRPADDHDDEVAIHDAFVAHRRLQQMPVFGDPGLQVEGRNEGHGSRLMLGREILAFPESRVPSQTSSDARSPFSSSHCLRSEARFLASSMSISCDVALPSSTVSCTSRRVSGWMVDSRNCDGFISPSPLNRVTETWPLIFSRSIRASSASRSD